MDKMTSSQDMIDLAAVERRANELRAEVTAEAFRAARVWLRDHLHFGKTHSPSA